MTCTIPVNAEEVYQVNVGMKGSSSGGCGGSGSNGACAYCTASMCNGVSRFSTPWSKRSYCRIEKVSKQYGKKISALHSS